MVFIDGKETTCHVSGRLPEIRNKQLSRHNIVEGLENIRRNAIATISTGFVVHCA